jgi:hypothetical protein
MLQQNGIVDRRNQSVVTMAQSLLNSPSIPVLFSGVVVATAVYMLNRVPTKAVDGVTPYVHHLCTFRCIAYIKVMKLHQKKLDDHGLPVVFNDYEPSAKTWCFYNRATWCDVMSRDAVFDENGCGLTMEYQML